MSLSAGLREGAFDAILMPISSEDVLIVDPEDLDEAVSGIRSSSRAEPKMEPATVLSWELES